MMLSFCAPKGIKELFSTVSVVPQSRDEICTTTEKKLGCDVMQGLIMTRLPVHDYELKRALSASACQFSRLIGP